VRKSKDMGSARGSRKEKISIRVLSSAMGSNLREILEKEKEEAKI